MSDQSTQSIVIDAPAADVMAVIADFDAYPQWVSAAKQVEVVETGDDGRARQVHFVIDAGPVKDDYLLDYTWDGDRKVSWTLVKGQLQKRNDGSYTLAERDGATEVTYAITIDWVDWSAMGGRVVAGPRALGGQRAALPPAGGQPTSR